VHRWPVSPSIRVTLGRMRDTHPKARAKYFELLRQAGPQRRLEACLSLSRTVRQLAIAGIKQMHPHQNLTDQEIRQKLAERPYGTEVAQRLLAGHSRCPSR